MPIAIGTSAPANPNRARPISGGFFDRLALIAAMDSDADGDPGRQSEPLQLLSLDPGRQSIPGDERPDDQWEQDDGHRRDARGDLVAPPGSKVGADAERVVDGRERVQGSRPQQEHRHEQERRNHRHDLESAIPCRRVTAPGREDEPEGEHEAAERREQDGQPGDRLQIEPAERRRVRRHRERHGRPEDPDRVAIPDEDHEPADQVTRPANHEQGADRCERDSKDREADEREVTEPERARDLRDRVDEPDGDRAERAR